MSGRFYGLYNVVNRIDEKRTIMQMRYKILKKIDELIEKSRPDVVISTLPIISKYMSEYRKTVSRQFYCITCITDIMPHNEWISDGTFAYMAGDEMTKEILIDKGVNPEKIFVGGIPVKKEFKADIPNKHKDVKEILIMGGGLGLIPGVKKIIDEIRLLPNVHMRVITGKNKKLRQALENSYDDIDIIGYTDEVMNYMKNADVLISKAGGITIFEAIYSETPILALYPFLEQEKKNAEFIKRKCIGSIMDKNKDRQLYKVSELLFNEKKLESIKRQMRQMKEIYEMNGITNIIHKLGI